MTESSREMSHTLQHPSGPRPGGTTGTGRHPAPASVEPELVHGPVERIHRPGGKQGG